MRIHFFKSGSHTPGTGGQAVSFSEEAIKAIAANYNPSLHEAPIVVGHPKSDNPAYGWVKSIEFADDGLYAEVDEIDPAFSEVVKAGSYKKVSAAFYSPGSPNNPRPGGYYLRHIGFLGAQPPAVKGLRAVEFKDTDEDLVFAEFDTGLALSSVADVLQSLRDNIIAEKGLDAANQAIPLWELDDLRRIAAEKKAAPVSQPNSPPNFSETIMNKEEELALREKALVEREAVFAEKTRSQHATFIDGMIKQGRVPAAQKGAFVAFLEAQDQSPALTFSEGDAQKQQSSLSFAQGLISALPPAVTFGEIAKGDGVLRDDNLNPMKLAQEATIFQEAMREKGIIISSTEAVAAVTRGENK